MCVRRSPPMIRRSPAGRGRVDLALDADERNLLSEVSHLEIRLAKIRDIVVAQARARSRPPRTTQRDFMR
jgi:hypothetical protein